jgi:hypothetical protein
MTDRGAKRARVETSNYSNSGSESEDSDAPRYRRNQESEEQELSFEEMCSRVANESQISKAGYTDEKSITADDLFMVNIGSSTEVGQNVAEYMTMSEMIEKTNEGSLGGGQVSDEQFLQEISKIFHFIQFNFKAARPLISNKKLMVCLAVQVWQINQFGIWDKRFVVEDVEGRKTFLGDPRSYMVGRFSLDKVEAMATDQKEISRNSNLLKALAVVKTVLKEEGFLALVGDVIALCTIKVSRTQGFELQPSRGEDILCKEISCTRDQAKAYYDAVSLVYSAIDKLHLTAHSVVFLQSFANSTGESACDLAVPDGEVPERLQKFYLVNTMMERGLLIPMIRGDRSERMHLRLSKADSLSPKGSELALLAHSVVSAAGSLGYFYGMPTQALKGYLKEAARRVVLRDSFSYFGAHSKIQDMSGASYYRRTRDSRVNDFSSLSSRKQVASYLSNILFGTDLLRSHALTTLEDHLSLSRQLARDTLSFSKKWSELQSKMQEDDRQIELAEAYSKVAGAFEGRSLSDFAENLLKED